MKNMQYMEIHSSKMFEDIKHIDSDGNEYWYARELQGVLDYSQWRSINELIERAKIACEGSKHNVDSDFAVERKIVKAGATTKKIKDYKLSRYACYLIVMNGDSRKEVRNSIKRMSGVMPENLPNPNISLKEFDKLKKNDNVIKNS